MRATIFIITAVLLSIAAAVTAEDKKKTHDREKSERVIGSGVLKSEIREVAKFNAVTLKGSADVFITVGEKTEVSVKTDDNILPYITTEVQENRLVISTKPHISLQYKELKVSITTPNISEVKVEGSGDITIAGLKGDSFKIVINGSGDVVAKGQVQKLECLIQGSGDLAFSGLEAKDVNIKIAGSGDAKVNAIESLQANIFGSGDIVYKNNAHLKVTKRIFGSGEIQVMEPLGDDSF